MITKSLQKLTGLSAALCLGFALNARADAVSDWNVIAIQAINAAGNASFFTAPFTLTVNRTLARPRVAG